MIGLVEKMPVYGRDFVVKLPYDMRACELNGRLLCDSGLAEKICAVLLFVSSPLCLLWCSLADMTFSRK